MKNTTIAAACLLMAAGLTACGGKNNSPAPRVPTIVTTPPIEDKGWAFETTPYFADEFAVNGAPASANWTYENGGGGWGNNELEYYTPGNATVADGKLTITAKKEPMGGMAYTSTRLVSKGLKLAKFGRIEVKAKLPKGTGIWPAIWMMPQESKYGGWPNSGEIDIMEMVGFDPGNIHFTVHNKTFFGANGQGGAKMVPTFNSDFHLYRVDWTPYALRGYVDGALIYTYTNNGGGSAVYPYDQDFFLILNVAVGGNWAGQKGVDDAIFPTSMDVDYVHFFKMIDK